MNAMFSFGTRVVEDFSKIEGIVDKIEFSIYSEPRYRIQRDGVDADGNLWPEIWFFESRLTAI